jgi:N-acetylglucosamine-6-sulfatase
MTTLLTQSLRTEAGLPETAPTPNLDRFAHEGALFSNAFCTNSICSPFTGLRDHLVSTTIQMVSFDLGGRIPPGKQMLP